MKETNPVRNRAAYTKRLLITFMGMGALGILLAGCGSSAPAARSTPKTLKASWNSPPVSMVLVYNPNPPVALKTFQTHMTLKTAEGAPVTGAHVVLFFKMAIMDMPAQSFTLHSTGPGKYSGHSVFLMAGKWNVVTDIAVQGRTLKEKFSVNVSD